MCRTPASKFFSVRKKLLNLPPITAEYRCIILLLDFYIKLFILFWIHIYLLYSMFSLSVVEKPSFEYSQTTLDEISQLISKNISYQQNWTLNIVFLDPNGIQNLNKKYRNIDKVTDVLSFHYFDNFSELSQDDIAWELAFCEEKIISQWIEYWLWTEKEFYKLVIHSVLHVLWYDHESDDEYEEMKKLEELIWGELFEENN